ncbi:cytochrome P450 2K3-like [Nematolebias whitei]|uniref:cytochrome P450 2K3-like n=1 Tax=Nematolebias whitei TaxID=451745 RepID=UPI00189BD03C|nr:cytochrome P450 2K3-like [Nematolebias whitei]
MSTRNMMEVILQSPTSVSLFGVFVVLLVLQLLYSSFGSPRSRELPGPRPVPLLGNLLQVDLKRLDQSLFHLSRTFGPIFQVYFGPKKVVVLAGYRTVKEALLNQADEFGNREITPLFYDFTQGHGILFSNGDSWKEMRHFALTTLRKFGMGKKMSEEIIIQECGYLIEEMKQYKGKAFNNTQAINYAVSNVVSALVFGKRFEYEDPVFQKMVERDNKIIHLIGSVSLQIYNFMPWLGPFFKNWKNVMKNVEDGKADAWKKIVDLKETLNPELCRCFVDAFLIHKKHLEESGIRNSHYHDDNLVYSVATLFAAGTDTTSTTLKRSLLYMVKFPHIQDHVQEELSRVVGRRQLQNLEDRKDLPYTDAVLHETQRFANITPIVISHTTSKDATFQGYFIKMDEGEWGSTHSFNLSNSQDKEAKFIRRDAFMSDAAGHNVCLEESLSRMELFLFFTSLSQHFCSTPPLGTKKVKLCHLDQFL